MHTVPHTRTHSNEIQSQFGIHLFWNPLKWNNWKETKWFDFKLFEANYLLDAMLFLRFVGIVNKPSTQNAKQVKHILCAVCMEFSGVTSDPAADATRSLYILVIKQPGGSGGSNDNHPQKFSEVTVRYTEIFNDC